MKQPNYFLAVLLAPALLFSGIHSGSAQWKVCFARNGNAIAWAPALMHSASGEGIIAFPERDSTDESAPDRVHPSTQIGYRIAGRSCVILKLYNLIGNEIATIVDGRQEAGTYAVRFDTSILAGGVYFFKLIVRRPKGGQAGPVVHVKRMIVMK
jgi:hypothetical protein